jgi:hypothetical protein
MDRIIQSSEAHWSQGERTFVRLVQQYPPRSITLGQLARHAAELFAFVFCIGAVIGLIVGVVG